MNQTVWLAVGGFAIAASVAAYRANYPDGAIAAGFGTVTWFVWALGALNVERPVGQCCVHQYEFTSLALLGVVAGVVSLLSAVNTTLGAFGGRNLAQVARGEDVAGWQE